MGQSRAVAGTDRLPWLADEPQPPARRRRSDAVAWAALAVLLAGGASYWLSVNSGALPVGPNGEQARTIVALPPATMVQQARPEVLPERAPEVAPTVAPPMPAIPPQRSVASPLLKAAPAVQPTDEVKESPAKSVAPPPAEAADPWPVRALDGAAGRLVRIGTFESARKAKKGWWAIVRMNPSLKRLPALVVPVQSLRDGRTYYRLQMGTTSQAHSTVLCQRMRMIAQSCVVVGIDAEAAK